MAKQASEDEKRRERRRVRVDGGEKQRAHQHPHRAPERNASRRHTGKTGR